ncbi:MAG TPA: globin domain-containing protein [Chitinophagaceae bacterium]|jgi:hemoglobin-like flavoprotein|nr:globin domain-containing protein [Chitinophagaceae bacterium]
MTDQQILAVRKTWKIIRAIDPVLVGDVFYEKLFSDQPGLRRLFHTGRAEQSRKLVDMLSYLVARLDTFPQLAADIAALGRRHTAYGVRPEHYPAVGTALIWTLRQALGNDWSPEAATAWEACYRELAECMQRSESVNG